MSFFSLTLSLSLSLVPILILYWHLCSFAIVYTKSIKLLYEPCNVTRIMHFPCSDAIENDEFHHYSSLYTIHSCLHSFRIGNKYHFTVRLGAIQLIFHRKNTEANNFSIALMEMRVENAFAININTERGFLLFKHCLFLFHSFCCLFARFLSVCRRSIESHENFTRFKSIVNIKKRICRRGQENRIEPIIS